MACVFEGNADATSLDMVFLVEEKYQGNRRGVLAFSTGTGSIMGLH